jgi:hypothetical protein
MLHDFAVQSLALILQQLVLDLLGLQLPQEIAVPLDNDRALVVLHDLVQLVQVGLRRGSRTMALQEVVSAEVHILLLTLSRLNTI